MKKVLITPRSFGKYNREELIEKLRQHGIEPVFNPYGTIMNEQQMRSALQDMDGLIVGVDPVSEEALRQAPRLRAIAKHGVLWKLMRAVITMTGQKRKHWISMEKRSVYSDWGL